MAANIFGRYVWLVDILLRHKQLTYEQIKALWQQSGLSYGENDSLPLRTFHNHRKAIKDIFNVYIECNTSNGYRYYIDKPEKLISDSLRYWLVSSYAALNQIHADKRLNGRIIFENVPSGHVWLTAITDAMRRNKTLNITHWGFEKLKPSTFEIEPYYLKVVSRRWYVIARNPYYSDKSGTDVYRCYALDRISNIKETDKTFSMNKDFNIEKHFSGCCGIMTSDEPVQRVVVKAYKGFDRYLDTLPLHESQKKLKSNADCALFEYHVKPTFDFYQLLLAQGSQIEVMEPESVRNMMGQYAADVAAYYKKRADKK